MRKQVIGGFLSLLGAILILNSFSGITGFAISKGIGTSTSTIFGIVLFVCGLALLALGEQESLEKRLQENLARDILKRGRVLSKPREIKKVVDQMGYDYRKTKEGLQVLDRNGRPLTVIPKHPTISYGVYKNIMKALATGESNFRRYGI